MPKPSKTAIELSLTEWLRLKMKAMKIGTKLAADIQPFKEAFERKSKSFIEQANTELRPINERMALLVAEIEKEMRKGVDEDAGTIALAQVLVGKGNLSAIAEILKEDGDRVIDAHKFFDAVKPVDRSAGFWECLKVQIGKAEKFLGSRIDELAKKPAVFKFKVSLPELDQKKKAA